MLQGPTDRAGDVADPQPARLTVAEPVTVSGAGGPARSACTDARGLGLVPDQHQPVALPRDSGDLERGLGDVAHQHGVAVAQHGQRAEVRRHGHRHRDELSHDSGRCGGRGCGGSRLHLLGCPHCRMGQPNADQVVGLGRNDHSEGRSDRALGQRRRVVHRRRSEQAGTRRRGLSGAPPRPSIERRCGRMGGAGLLQVLLIGQGEQVDLRTACHRRPRGGLTQLKSEAVRHAPISPVRAEHATLIRRRRNPRWPAPPPLLPPRCGTCPLLPRTTTPQSRFTPTPDEVARRPARTARSSRGIARPTNGRCCSAEGTDPYVRPRNRHRGRLRVRPLGGGGRAGPGRGGRAAVRVHQVLPGRGPRAVRGARPEPGFGAAGGRSEPQAAGGRCDRPLPDPLADPGDRRSNRVGRRWPS